MNNSEKLVIITAFFIVAVGVFTGLSTVVSSLDISAVPEWALPIVKAAIAFFSATPIIFLVSYFRNILGYLKNWVIGHGTPATEYELRRYTETLVKYIAFIGPFAAAIPAPFTSIGTALGVIVALIVDIATSTWAQAKTYITPPAA